MSKDNADQMDRNPFMAPGEASLAELLQRIEGDARLTATRRRDVASALRSLGRILALPLTAIPANPMWLRARLRRFHPQQVGISRKRWQNIRADLGFALSVSIPRRARPDEYRVVGVLGDSRRVGRRRGGMAQRRVVVGMMLTTQAFAFAGVDDVDGVADHGHRRVGGAIDVVGSLG